LPESQERGGGEKNRLLVPLKEKNRVKETSPSSIRRAVSFSCTSKEREKSRESPGVTVHKRKKLVRLREKFNSRKGGTPLVSAVIDKKERTRRASRGKVPYAIKKKEKKKYSVGIPLKGMGEKGRKWTHRKGGPTFG